MKIYTILHRWNNLDYEGCELVDAYLDQTRAIQEMKALADNERRAQEENGYEWDGDFCQNSDTYISYGFYGSGFCADTTYEWELVEQEVIE